MAATNELPEQPAPLEVVYSYNISDPVYRKQSQYIGKVIDLVMEESREPYKLRILPVETTPALRTARLIHRLSYITAIHTTRSFEENLHAIHYPVYMGLTGWRVFFVRASDVASFQGISTPSQLGKLVAGQGINWPDNPVLESNGLPVVAAANRDSLFRLLSIRRIDYFPRALYEIENEYEIFKPAGIAIEPSLILRYATATFLFAPKENKRLIAALELGFERAVSNGRFQALFLNTFGPQLKQLQLERRRIVTLENPNQSNTLPLHRKELWFDLKMLRALPQ